jgi:hypothetical protein
MVKVGGQSLKFFSLASLAIFFTTHYFFRTAAVVYDRSGVKSEKLTYICSIDSAFSSGKSRKCRYTSRKWIGVDRAEKNW